MNVHTAPVEVRSRHYKHWTPEEIAHLKEAAGEGATQGEVSEELGRTRKGINQMATVLGIRFQRSRPTNPAGRSVILSLLCKRYTLREIARKTKKNFNAVRMMILRMERDGTVYRECDGPHPSGGRRVRYRVSNSYGESVNNE